ncbi:MAG: transcriptional regulator [Myxococcales bacterium FL481]|nr:MAG: transcriptional regulator [Myxococcales bacterium FL481]
MNNLDLAKLSSRAWSLPVLAHLSESDGCRVSPTAHAVGAGRNIVGQTFRHLADVGMLQRAAGHGHPLRPEFQLTPRGKAVAAWARTFLSGMSDNEWKTARRAWTLPVLRLLRDPCTFTELSTSLQPVTDRGLSLCLSRMIGARFIEPRTMAELANGYVAIGRGRELTHTLDATFHL